MEYIQRLRAKVGNEKLLIPATALVILNKKNEVLLHLRNDSLTWGLPGGLMDTDETVLESVAREALEETGLRVRNALFYGIFSGAEYEVQYPNGDLTAPVILGFYTDEFEGEPMVSEEAPQIGFFSFHALPSPMNQFHQKFVDGYLRFRAQGSVPVIL